MRSVGETSWSRCSRSARDRPTRCPASNCVLRSFRTYMSIEKRVDSFSRSFRTLIKNTRNLLKHIKDLKDLGILLVCAGYRHSGPKGPEENKRRFSASRTMARDRPPHYDEGEGFLPPRPREARRPIASRPGGLSYRGTTRIKTWKVPTQIYETPSVN